MNVCLVTSAADVAGLTSSVPTSVASLGFRVVVLCLEPQGRRLWSAGQVVYAAPTTSGGDAEPWEAAYRRRLDGLRREYFPVLQSKRGKAAALARLIERQGFKALRLGGALIAGRAETAVDRVRAGLQGKVQREPLRPLPLAPQSFAVYHALDAGAVEAARRGAEVAGAMYLGPEVNGDLQQPYEKIIMQWLSA